MIVWLIGGRGGIGKRWERWRSIDRVCLEWDGIKAGISGE